jgi:DNA mismatch repair protein MutL
MADIIKLLPDSVANQIAAGEVVQRPASVIKELMENSIDAGSTSITVNIKDAGRTLIQIIDNGCGMSDTDARMSFERHATSKIKSADDLFAIRTMGFRGEALASIAAIAEVNVKTRKQEDSIGTSITISASRIINQESISCPAGTNFSVRNLFFNVPARRKFLKSDAAEMKNIINEFTRVVLVNPDVEFILIHNNTELYNLPKSAVRQRIVHVFGKNINHYLVTLQSDTTIIQIKGFIGKPDFAKRTAGEQYFFVNNRFMKHPYFNNAIMKAYENIIKPGTFPSYFIYLETDPSSIDVNIHPTKTEIKFENEKAIWQILHSTVKESLGKNNIIPSIDFDTEGIIEIPVFKKDDEIRVPGITIDPEYNPFEEEKKHNYSYNQNYRQSIDNVAHWDKLYEGFEAQAPVIAQKEEEIEAAPDELYFQTSVRNFFQFKNKYILTSVKSGLMIIHQKRAHERILFEKYMNVIAEGNQVAQKTLFPRIIELNDMDHKLLLELVDDFTSLGFEISDFGNQSVVVNSYPTDNGDIDPLELIETFLEEYKNDEAGFKEQRMERTALSLSRAASINHGRSLSPEEMRSVVDQLFACQNPGISPDGKAIISILNIEEIESRF